MIDKKLVKAFVQDCIEEQEWRQRFEDNHMQVEDFFRYSGKVEEESEDFKNLTKSYEDIKANPRKPKCRKEYFKKYWQEYKLNLR